LNLRLAKTKSKFCFQSQPTSFSRSRFIRLKTAPHGLFVFQAAPGAKNKEIIQ